MATDDPNEPWLKPQQETDAQKAERKRRAQEAPPSARHAVRQLDELRKPKPPAEPERPAAAQHQQRIDPKAIVERGEEPQPVSERPAPRAIIEPGPAPTAPPAERADPDPRLVEIAGRLWPWLSERDRDELLLIAKLKVHLNQKAAK